MTGKTHILGGTLSCLSGFILLNHKGMLLSDVNPLLQLTMMYPYAIFGSLAPDLDHHWESAPCKELVGKSINSILHLSTPLRKKGIKLPLMGIFDAKHRSWQTHSDLFMLVCFLLCRSFVFGSVSDANGILLKLMLTGLILGLFSHMVLDMLTRQGLHSLLFKGINKLVNLHLSEKLRLVPNSEKFSTDSKWENFIRVLLWGMCFVLMLIVVYIISPYKLVIEL